MTPAAPARDLTAEIAFLTRALKAPTLRDCVDRLADRAREQGWSHEEFLVVYLQREVSARDSHGGEGRIRAARFPGRKSLEDFDFDFDFDRARGLECELIAHLGTLDFVTGHRPQRRQLPPQRPRPRPHHPDQHRRLTDPTGGGPFSPVATGSVFDRR